MIEKITAGVDWLSLSMPNTASTYHEWRYKCTLALGSIAKDGYVVEPRKLLGYDGVSVGNCFLGENEGGSFAQFSGEKANDVFSEVYDANCKVSRLDVQLTVKYDEMPPNVAKGAYRDAIRANEGLPMGRRRKIYIIVGSDGGDTAYIGSPSSEQRGRIYNKEAQSELVAYTRCWRYEIVLRNQLSTDAARYCPNSPTERTDWAISLACEWFRRRGIVISGVQSGMTVALPLERTRPTDVERKLEWLRTQVAPTVRYLRSLGFESIIREALELEGP